MCNGLPECCNYVPYKDYPGHSALKEIKECYSIANFCNFWWLAGSWLGPVTWWREKFQSSREFDPSLWERATLWLDPWPPSSPGAEQPWRALSPPSAPQQPEASLTREVWGGENRKSSLAQGGSAPSFSYFKQGGRDGSSPLQHPIWKKVGEVKSTWSFPPNQQEGEGPH